MGQGDSAARGNGKHAKRLSRGGFLKAGATAAAAVGAVPLAQAASGATRQGDPLAYLRLATYESLRGATFTLSHPHAPLQARLIEVLNLTTRGPRERARRESFSLVFEVKKDEPLAQGTYTLEHRAIGPFQLFLVPIGRGVKGFYLEGVVNRWLDARHS